MLPRHLARHRGYPSANVGLVVLELLCVVGVFAPDLYAKSIGSSEWFNVSSIVMIVALAWMLVFILLDIRDIFRSSGKFSEGFPLKNLFVVFVIGYVMF